MQPHFRDVLDSIGEELSDADYGTKITPEQIGHIIIAAKQLADLVERLYDRIIDLEKVQQEYAIQNNG